MSNISLFTIWSLSEHDAEMSLETLLKKGYKLNTESTNVYVKIMSCIIKVPNVFALEIEKQIVSDSKFLEILENPEEGESHNNLLIRAVYETGKNHEMFKIRKLQEETAVREAVERKKKHAEEIKMKEEKAGLLLENTYLLPTNDICPLNTHDESSFYSVDPKTGSRELLKPHHIFQYKGHCYDIDSIFRYIITGGHINLESQYIKRIFNK